MQDLLQEIRQCKHCEATLPCGARPIVAGQENSKIVLVSQAPGSVVHKTGIAWDDKSGERLRAWLNVSNDTFYDPNYFAVVPLGFCYPGRGKSGDLPPLKACVPLWHPKLWEAFQAVELVLLIGNYAQKYYLGKQRQKTLTAAIQHWADYGPKYIPLPDPSLRNNIWLKKNSWFETEIIPILQERVAKICVI